MNISAIIMAGGKATRFAGDVPKCLAPLSDGSTLLGRLIQQLRDARVEEIIICCSPENVESITQFVGARAKAVACASCDLGPLPALAEALRHSSGERKLLCLADIYFHKSPFGQLEGESLAIGQDGSTAGSGWVVRDRQAVRGISYLRTPNADARWTGTFLFDKHLAAHLSANVDRYTKKPFEAWISDLIAEGNSLQWIDAGAFVNVNTGADYARVLEMTRPTVHEHHAVAAPV